jgi:hypothetical protein
VAVCSRTTSACSKVSRSSSSGSSASSAARMALVISPSSSSNLASCGISLRATGNVSSASTRYVSTSSSRCTVRPRWRGVMAECCTSMRPNPSAWMRKSVNARPAPPDTAEPTSGLPAKYFCDSFSSSSLPRGAGSSSTWLATSTSPFSDLSQPSGTASMAVFSNSCPVPLAGTRNQKRVNSVCRSHFSRNGPRSALKWLADAPGTSTPYRPHKSRSGSMSSSPNSTR